jgi:hypothetical protein
MEYKKVRDRKIGKTTEKVTRIRKTNGKITIADVKNMSEVFKRDNEKKFKYFDVPLLKVNVGGSWFTFTNDKFNEYFEDKVKDPSKFYQFDEVHMYVHYEE